MARTGEVLDEAAEGEEPDNATEDGLDLWSVLYGLE